MCFLLVLVLAPPPAAAIVVTSGVYKSKPPTLQSWTFLLPEEAGWDETGASFTWDFTFLLGIRNTIWILHVFVSEREKRCEESYVIRKYGPATETLSLILVWTPGGSVALSLSWWSEKGKNMLQKCSREGFHSFNEPNSLSGLWRTYSSHSSHSSTHRPILRYNSPISCHVGSWGPRQKLRPEAACPTGLFTLLECFSRAKSHFSAFMSGTVWTCWWDRLSFLLTEWLREA